jgi:hypothetical protein
MGWTHNEAHAKSRAQQAECFGALFRRRDVADVGGGGGNTGGTQAREHASQKQPAQRRGKRHDCVVESKTEVRQQDDWPPAKAVGEQAEHGRKEELHQRDGSDEQAEIF